MGEFHWKQIKARETAVSNTLVDVLILFLIYIIGVAV
jgi:hypothetical protein